MQTNLLNHNRLSIPDEPKLIPGSSNFSAPANLSLPETWLEALSTDAPVAKALAKIWKPLAVYVPQAVERIIKCTLQLGLAIYPDEDQDIRVNLLYIFQSQDKDNLAVGWFAGYPATDEVIAEAQARLSIILPASYKKFIRVHNGFNLYPIDVGPCMANSLHFIRELAQADQVFEHQANRFLAFSGDGAGNQQCYDLTIPLANSDYLTFDWDHETRQIAKPMSFFAYVEDLMMTELETARLRKNDKLNRP